MTLTLTINGTVETIDEAPLHRTLLEHLRARGRVGTKEGCAEGDCGACTVALLERGRDGRGRYRAVNSCLLPLVALAGREVITVEALARPADRTHPPTGFDPADHDALHPVQRAMVAHGGSQCGYCTPGFVMSLFCAYYQRNDERETEPDHAIEGNLCRCTGYLPIRAAAAALPPPAADERFARALERPVAPLPEIEHHHGDSHFYRPTRLARVVELLRAHPDATLLAGATDLGVEMNKLGRRFPVLIALDAVPELDTLTITDDEVVIGAGVTLSRLERDARGLFPALDEMLRWFAARQIRNRATLGGNLGTASPIGDLPPVLLALDATVRTLGPDGAREIPIDGFFRGYRQTALQPGELITAVGIPRRPPAGTARRLTAAYKVGKRGTDDISIVAAAFTLDLDDAGRVVRARLAYGGVAPTPLRAHAVEQQLVGRPWNEQTAERAAGALRRAFEPISDHRGSAAYRRALCGNLFEKFYAEHADPTPAEATA